MQQILEILRTIIRCSPFSTEQPVLVNGEVVWVEDPITFSQLDDIFGKGNWSLPS